MDKQLIKISPDELRKALKDIEEAENNGFMHCIAVFTQSDGHNECWVEGKYSDLWERAHPTDGRLDWGRGQYVTKRNKFVDGKTVLLKSYVEESDHIISGRGFLDHQVCSRGTEDEALEWLQKESPAGTTNNWQKQDEHKPVKCDDYEDRTHYLFQC